MAKFKALQAKDQFFTFEGQTYRFINGEFSTENPAIIEFLEKNHASEKVEEETAKKGK